MPRKPVQVVEKSEEKVPKIPKEQISEEPTTTKPEEVRTTPEIDTSDWKTYRNEEYGYEIKYPKEGELREGYAEKPYLEKLEVIIPCFVPVSRIPQEDLAKIPEVAIKEGEVQIGATILELGVAENRSQLPVKEWARKYLELPEYLEVRDFVLNRIEGAKIDFLPSRIIAGGCEMFYLPKGTKIISIGFCGYEAWYYSSPEIATKEKLKEKTILSTFKFLD